MQNYNTHIVEVTDTIQFIATKYNCNWIDIVRLNNLSYPYLSSDFTGNVVNGVAGVGSLLILPIKKEVAIKITTSIEDKVFGCDLKFSRNYYNHLEPSNLEASTDIHKVKGLENLSQALTSRLTVEKGDLVLHPEYGTELRHHIGKPMTKQRLIRIKLEIIRSLSQDHRIQKIKDVRVEGNLGSIYIEVDVVPIKPLDPFTLTYRR